MYMFVTFFFAGQCVLFLCTFSVACDWCLKVLLLLSYISLIEPIRQKTWVIAEQLHIFIFCDVNCDGSDSMVTQKAWEPWGQCSVRRTLLVPKLSRRGDGGSGFFHSHTTFGGTETVCWPEFRENLVPCVCMWKAITYNIYKNSQSSKWSAHPSSLHRLHCHGQN